MADKNTFVGKVKNFFTRSESINDLSAFIQGNQAAGFSDFFGRDVFNEEEMTPHNEMGRVREMIDNNAFIASGLSKYQAIFIGEHITVEAESDRTKKQMQEWLEESGLVEAFSNGGIGEHFKGIGNSYYHVKNGTVTDRPKEFELIAKPENMWIRKNPDGSVKDYVLEVERSVQGDDVYDENVQTYELSYGGYKRDTVFGVQFEKDEIVHVPQGMHQIPPYGRSDLASASSDEKILREIERSYGIMARHKQVPKMMWILKDRMNEGPLDSETFQEVKKELNNLSDKDNPILNGNVDAEKIDYSYGGAEIKMQETIDYLKRKITGPVLPQSLMHPDMTTQATAQEEMKALFLRIRGERQEHKKRFNPILRRVADGKGLDTTGLTLSFGELDLTTAQGKRERALDMWQKGVITLNEAREKIGLSEDEQFDEDPYQWEVQSQPAGGAQQIQQTLRQAIDDD